MSDDRQPTNSGKQQSQRLILGAGFGMLLGLIIGMVIGHPLGGLSIGMPCGALIGLLWDWSQRKR